MPGLMDRVTAAGSALMEYLRTGDEDVKVLTHLPRLRFCPDCEATHETVTPECQWCCSPTIPAYNHILTNRETVLRYIASRQTSE